MPTYDYQCRDCGNVTEVIHSMLEDGPAVCERCGGPLRRVLFPTGIIFKGSGFYRNDSRKAASDQASDRGSGSGSEKAAASASDTPSGTAGTGGGATSEAGTSGSTSPKGSGER